MATTVRAAAAIPLSREACWQRFLDLTRAKDYVPGLTDTVITTEKKQGVGASRVVSHSQFGDMDETVVEWDEGVGLTVRLHKGDRPARPLDEAAFRYELRPTTDPDRCEIHTSMTYVLPWGPFGRLLDRLFLGRVFRRNVVDTAVCLAEHYETDRPVPESELPRLRGRALPSPAASV